MIKAFYNIFNSGIGIHSAISYHTSKYMPQVDTITYIIQKANICQKYLFHILINDSGTVVVDGNIIY